MHADQATAPCCWLTSREGYQLHLSGAQRRLSCIPIVLQQVKGRLSGNGHQRAALAPVHPAGRHIDAAHHLWGEQTTGREQER